MATALDQVGAVRKLANAAVVATTVNLIDRRSAELQQQAAVDTRAAILEQQCTTIRAAFFRAVDLAFETSPGGIALGRYSDGRVRFPVPWSTRSYRRYGLTHTTASILRILVVDWKSGFWHPTGHAPAPAPAPIFVTDKAGNWFVNLCYTSTLAISTATLTWPSVDTVAYLQSDLTLKETAARMKRKQRKRDRKRSG